MENVTTPRSTLHAVKPIGLGTPDVESLTGYFCRLAYSHAVSATHLANGIMERFGHAVPADFKWCQRNFVSMGAETERWAAWLAELTGVGHFDLLTLVPWRSLLGVPGLVPQSDRWCPHCLAEDRAAGQDPYLRLSWDLAPATVCLKHKVELIHLCPHCNRSNVRNRASIVVPGYCTVCGGFLGEAETLPATPEALWIARQVGLMLSNPPVPGEGERISDTMRLIIARMAGGNVARFAYRLRLSKSTVWNWVNRGGQPTLRAWLDVSRHSGLALDKLMRGDLEGWVPPLEPPQLALCLAPSERKGVASRVLDWEAISEQLQAILSEETPITMAETCLRVGVDAKLLYLRVNQHARAISARYRDFELQEKRRREQALKNALEDVLEQRLSDGYDGMSARDVRELLAGTELANVRNVFALIKQVREEADE